MVRKIAILVFSFVALMTTMNVHAAGKGKKRTPNPSCLKIREACEAAGYSPDVAKDSGKRRGKSCVKPILAGMAIAGVSVAESDIQACKAHREARRAKKDRKLKGAEQLTEVAAPTVTEAPVDVTGANSVPGTQ